LLPDLEAALKLWIAGLMCVAFGVYGFFPASFQTWIMPLWMSIVLIISGGAMMLFSGDVGATPDSVED
jgi:hypothetical protein